MQPYLLKENGGLIWQCNSPEMHAKNTKWTAGGWAERVTFRTGTSQITLWLECALSQHLQWSTDPEALNSTVRTIDGKRLPWPDLIVTICMSYLTTGGPAVLVRNMKLTSYHQPEEFGQGQKERGDSSPNVPINLPESFSLEFVLAERCTHHQEGP